MNVFLPEGMFGASEDVGQAAIALLAGRVEARTELTCTATARVFMHVRIGGLPGPIDLVADVFEGTPAIGGIAVARAWLVGTPEIGPGDADIGARRPRGSALRRFLGVFGFTR